MEGSDQVAAAVRKSLKAAHDATVAAGIQPGTSLYLERVAAVLGVFQAGVWRLPADPDELLRHEEAARYQAMRDDPKLLRRTLAEVGKGGLGRDHEGR